MFAGSNLELDTMKKRKDIYRLTSMVKAAG